MFKAIIKKQRNYYMSIKYKVDVLKLLKEKGYNTTRIRKEHIMGELMLQKIRKGQMMSWNTLDIVCNILDCQPGDLLEYKRDSSESSIFF